MNVSTMNVSGNDLAGDRVAISFSTFTGNLSHHAAMAANLLSSKTTFNLTQGSKLSLALDSGYQVGVSSAVVNLTGKNSLALSNTRSQVSVNLLHGARWDGTLNMGVGFGPTRGLTTVNGGPLAQWNNNGHSVIDNTETAVVNVGVVGTGTFDINAASPLPSAMARMEFASYVGPGQSITDSGVLVLDRPRLFAGHVTLATVNDLGGLAPAPGAPAPSLLPAEIDLQGLANADSYTFKNDMLSISSGNAVIDRLHLTDRTAHGFLIEKATGSLNIIAITDPLHIPAAMLDNALPLHC
jgi:hypothetical protein